IGRLDGRYALDINRALVDFGAERERSEDGKLLRRVVALDVEAGIGFGVAELLRFPQTCFEGKLLLLHPRQDVVAGAIEDAIEARDPAAGEPLAQRLDHRNGGSSG